MLDSLVVNDGKVSISDLLSPSLFPRRATHEELQWET